MKFPLARGTRALVGIALTIGLLSTLGASAAQAATSTRHCTSGGVNCAKITTDVQRGVPMIRKDNYRFNLTIASAIVIDKQNGKDVWSHTLTNSQIGHRRFQGFFFNVGSSADAICFDIKDDGKGFMCHKIVT